MTATAPPTFPIFPDASQQAVEETKQRIKEAIHLHLQGMWEDGEAIPTPYDL